MNAAAAEPLLPAGFEPLVIRSGFVGLIGPFYIRRPSESAGDDVAYGFRTRAAHGNVNGVLHGGSIFAFADTIAGQYIIARLGRVCATISMTSNFMASGQPGAWLEARPRLVKATRSLCYVTVDITADDVPVYGANAVFKLFGPVAGQPAEGGV